jgi:hypothetical protein
MFIVKLKMPLQKIMDGWARKWRVSEGEWVLGSYVSVAHSDSLGGVRVTSIITHAFSGSHKFLHDELNVMGQTTLKMLEWEPGKTYEMEAFVHQVSTSSRQVTSRGIALMFAGRRLPTRLTMRVSLFSLPRPMLV